VAKQTNEVTTQQRCRELLFWFDDVPATMNSSLDYQRMQRDRLIQHYMPAMPACLMILEHLNPLTREGDRQAISMLFPMEKVFEDFVAAKLPIQFENWIVSTQVRGQSLVQRHINHRIFKLIPDLEMRRGAVRLIADTKWKLLDQTDRSGKYNITQGDIYQLFAYAKKYLADQSVKEVYLIYPASDTFTKPLRAFWFQEGKEVLHVVPYDLESEELLLPEQHSVLNLAAFDRTGSDY
jgi:5-methylcytosine-specific restriction enzyme subunit McrC